MRGNKTIKGGVRRQRVNPIYGNLPLVLHWLVLRWYCIPAMENQFNWRYNIHLYVIAKYIEKARLRWKCVNQTYSLAAYHQPTNTSVMIGDSGVD